MTRSEQIAYRKAQDAQKRGERLVRQLNTAIDDAATLLTANATLMTAGTPASGDETAWSGAIGDSQAFAINPPKYPY